MANWKHNMGMFGSGNYVLSGDGFFISYNPAPGGRNGLFISDDGGAETALCRDGAYHILNGDFRDEYEALIDEGFDACKRFYESQKADHNSSWSNEAPQLDA